MQTPKIFIESINKGIITKEILEAAALSVNVRAKRARDKEREYRRKRYDKYDSEQKYRDIKEGYYRMKESLLSIISPACIHKENKYIEVRHYMGEYKKWEDYNEAIKESKQKGTFIREDTDYDFSFADRYIPYDEIDEAVECGEVGIDEYFVEKEPIYSYYLFYIMGDHSFHSKPLEMEDIEPYIEKYPMVDISQIHTNILDTKDLVSVQFVKKIIALITSGEYQLEG